MNLPHRASTDTVAAAPSVNKPLPVLEVAQGEFGFARVGTHAGVRTGDVSTCSGLVAIHQDQGLVFMIHVDAPWFDGSVKAALEELRNRCKGSERAVKLLDLSGITPYFSLFLSVVTPIALWLAGGVVQ